MMMSKYLPISTAVHLLLFLSGKSKWEPYFLNLKCHFHLIRLILYLLHVKVTEQSLLPVTCMNYH